MLLDQCWVHFEERGRMVSVLLGEDFNSSVLRSLRQLFKLACFPRDDVSQMTFGC